MDTSNEEYHRVKAFIDHCHANNIRVTFYCVRDGSVLESYQQMSLISRNASFFRLSGRTDPHSIE
jgi:hypothetical protein